MKYANISAAALPLKDVLWPPEVGKQVVSHVLPNAKAPEPDFEAMRRVIADRKATELVAPVVEESE